MGCKNQLCLVSFVVQARRIDVPTTDQQREPAARKQLEQVQGLKKARSMMKNQPLAAT